MFVIIIDHFTLISIDKNPANNTLKQKANTWLNGNKGHYVIWEKNQTFGST